MDLVVVESPAKAETINKYLGPEYKVLATYGHVRDLLQKDGSVAPDEGFRMAWQTSPRARKTLREISDAAIGARRVFLATDPDREGEAISWHVREILEEMKALDGVEVRRVVFHEVTPNAVRSAVANPRDLNSDLVDAYLARRALDYLVGFTLSPVLWRKLPGARSAGRVQSVALRLLCEREDEIERFRAREYWTVEADFTTAAGDPVTARLTHLDGRRLDRYDIADEAAARAAVAAVEGEGYAVGAVERKEQRRRPAPPFTTSTLQQEASRKLGFGATRTMRAAQRLYEGVRLESEAVGLISYMRTDSVSLSQEAIGSARAVIGREYGHRYIPAEPNRYVNRAKNAQEAHEAIRPTDCMRRPADVGRFLGDDERRLYDLVWKRAVASQMRSAVVELTAADIVSAGGAATLRATGTVIKFDGFMRLYLEDRDDRDPDDGDGGILPPMAGGDAMERGEVRPEQHFTKPPPRYSEASLVKRLEELGIGRPSTYASILQVLQDRGYATLDRRRFTPSERGRIVTAFLTGFFQRYVEYDFTADLERRLDDVSNGAMEWRRLLGDFWTAFEAAVRDTDGLRVRDVIDRLDEDLGPHFFPPPGDGSDPRKCPACGEGRLGLKLSKGSGFIGCSGYPECGYTAPLAVRDGEGAPSLAGPRSLGEDPEGGLEVTVRNGPYGPYVQLGEAVKGSKEKPKRVSVPDGVDPAEVDLEHALGLLSLPREVGAHPETGKAISAGLNRYGPYLLHDGRYTRLGPDDDVLAIGLNRAVDLIASAPAGRPGRGRAAGRRVGDHPDDGRPVELRTGRYGPYVSHGSLNANVPDGEDLELLTLERAVELLAERAARKGGGRKAAARKPAARKATAKKPAARKATAKKPAAGKPGPRGP